jgi:hypothetical protein
VNSKSLADQNTSAGNNNFNRSNKNLGSSYQGLGGSLHLDRSGGSNASSGASHGKSFIDELGGSGPFTSTINSSGAVNNNGNASGKMSFNSSAPFSSKSVLNNQNININSNNDNHQSNSPGGESYHSAAKTRGRLSPERSLNNSGLVGGNGGANSGVRVGSANGRQTSGQSINNSPGRHEREKISSLEMRLAGTTKALKALQAELHARDERIEGLCKDLDKKNRLIEVLQVFFITSVMRDLLLSSFFFRITRKTSPLREVVALQLNPEQVALIIQENLLWFGNEKRKLSKKRSKTKNQ